MKRGSNLQSKLGVISILAAVALCWAFPVAAGQGAHPLESVGVGGEMLLFQDIPSVLSASKYEQKVTEAPSSVSIVTSDEIKRYGYRTLGDILRSLRGFYVVSDRTNLFQGVRGFNRPGDSNSRFLLLVDGLRINDSIFSAAFIDSFLVVDIDLIDRVEVVRGPSSSLYGTNAFFGVINIITKRGRDFQGAEISAEAGTYDTYDGRFSYGRRFQTGGELLLSGTRFETDGPERLHFDEFDTATNSGTAENGNSADGYSLFGKFSFGDLTLEGAYVDREKQFPTAPYGTEFNDPRNRITGKQGVGQLMYEHHFADQFDLLARGSFNYYSSVGDYVYDYSTSPDPFIVINKDEFSGAWWGGEIQATKRLESRHTLILGGEYQNHYRQDQKNYDLSVYLDERHDSDNWGVYIQDEYQIFEGLIFNAGVRYDEYDSFGSTTNPRLALIYSPLDRTTLKFLYGEAFRAPNAFESFYHDGFETQKPNPDLDPESMTTYELVWEQYLGNHLRGIVNFFYYETEDLINLTVDPADGLLVFENVDEVEARGVEVELEGRWNGRIEGRASYSFQEAEDRNTGRLLTNSPKHLAKLNLILPLYEDMLLLGIEEQYTGRRKTLSGDEVGGYTVTNLTLFGQRMMEGLELSASVYNLFDKKFSDPVSAAHRQDAIEQDGQVFRFKITYAF